jgi:hypothetical protein
LVAGCNEYLLKIQVKGTKALENPTHAG